MNLRNITFALVTAGIMTTMSGCATEKVANEMHTVTNNLSNLFSGNYNPATVGEVGIKHMQALNSLMLAVGSLACYPNGAKTYIWRRVSPDAYDAARLGPPGGYAEMGGIGSGAEGQLKEAQHDAEETNALPLHSHVPIPDQLALHIAIGLVKYNDAAVGMYCAQTRAFGAVANVGVSSHPFEAWVNKGHLDTVLVRMRDPSGKNYSVTKKLTWEQVQEIINKAIHKGQQENF